MANMWDEPFRDGAPVLENGEWKEPETYTPAPDTSLKSTNYELVSNSSVEENSNLWESLENNSEVEEDDEDYSEVLSDARLRLEQGKLYEMIMNHSLFDGVEADPRAAKSVQKQIRKWAKTQMEIMLGMVSDNTSQAQGFISSPFNGLEVIVLKKIASVYSKGETESKDAETIEPPVQASKKTSLNTIGSKIKATKNSEKLHKPIQKAAEPIKRQPKPKQEINSEGMLTGKMLSEMTPEEKRQKIEDNIERNKGKIAIPQNRTPQPDYATQEMLAYQQVTRATNPGKNNLSAAIAAALKNTGKL